MLAENPTLSNVLFRRRSHTPCAESDEGNLNIISKPDSAGFSARFKLLVSRDTRPCYSLVRAISSTLRPQNPAGRLAATWVASTRQEREKLGWNGCPASISIGQLSTHYSRASSTSDSHCISNSTGNHLSTASPYLLVTLQSALFWTLIAQHFYRDTNCSPNMLLPPPNMFGIKLNMECLGDAKIR